MGSHINRSAAVQAALDGIRRIVQSLRVSSRAAEQGVGLSGAQLFVLRALGQHDELTMNELAAHTLTHQSSVSVVVRRLEERGLVTRARGGRDGRHVRVSLTAAGRRLLRAAPGVAQDQLIVALRRLSAADQRVLARGLGRLAQAMDAGRGRAPMFFEEATRKRSPR